MSKKLAPEAPTRLRTRTQPRHAILLSQTFANEANDPNVCPKYLQYKYIDEIEPDGEEEQGVMFRGLYFEWHLIGETRDGNEPIFDPRKTPRILEDGTRDYRPQAQLDLDELVPYARDILQKLGLDTRKGQKQLQIKADDLIGHIDWKTTDIQNPKGKALYDIKYTETAQDDIWRGWGDFSKMSRMQFQAVHYILLHKYKYGEYLPFYFLVFGKGKWCKVVQIKLTNDGIFTHETAINTIRENIDNWHTLGWPAKGSFNKCLECPYASWCKHKDTKPAVELYTV